MARIYLDNAATTWPKPDSVYDAVDQYLRFQGTPAGRGSYTQAAEVDRRLSQARSELAQLIGAEHANCIVFTYSGTDSLNLAIMGLLRPGDHVVTTDCEHNSVLRPLRELLDREQIQVTRVACDAQGYVDAHEILEAVGDNTRLVAMTHASNVTGAIQPIAEVCQGLCDRPTLSLIDAAQTVGRVPIDARQLGCDLLAAPGHKGLMAPTGTGFLYVAPGVESQLKAFRLGGTGTSSESDAIPLEMPTRFEAGNANVPGLLGMAAGIQYIAEQGVPQLANHESQLTRHLLDQLTRLPHATVYGPAADRSDRVAIVSFNLTDYDPHEVALVLDQAGPIQVRAGFHCAPRMHQSMKTDTMGGAVRISLGAFNTNDQVDQVVNTLQMLGR